MLDKLLTSEMTQHLWHPFNNWKDVLGAEHFKILTTFRHQQIDNVNTRLVYDLLNIIRNKYVHIKDFTDDDKATLGWFVKNGKKKVIQDDAWANYWTQKFPNLLPCMWTAFTAVSQVGKLKKFYPCHIKIDACFGVTHIEGFYAQLKMVLDQQTSEGNLLRYHFTVYSQL